MQRTGRQKLSGKEIIMNARLKDISIRAGKTFVQAALAALAVNVATVNDWKSLKPVLVGALAAGVSAAWNSLR